MNAIENEIKKALEVDRIIKVDLYETAQIFAEMFPKPSTTDHPF